MLSVYVPPDFSLKKVVSTDLTALPENAGLDRPDQAEPRRRTVRWSG